MKYDQIIEENKLIKIDQELTQLLELTEKDTKTVIIAILIY